MSPTTRISGWAASAAAATMIAALPVGAAPAGAESDSMPQPPPHIDSYQPFPAVWNQTITIHGSHLLPQPHPGTPAPGQVSVPGLGSKKLVSLLQPKNQLEVATPGESRVIEPVGSKPVLKWGTGKGAAGVIPASNVELWTSSEIRLTQLAGVQAGAYWIGVYQNGERVSNRNRTLFFAEGDPNAQLSLLETDALGSEDTDNTIQVAYPPVQEPNPPPVWVYSYAPTVVGYRDEVLITGIFGIQGQGNRRIMFGTDTKIIGPIHQEWIKGWSSYTIRFENGLLPTGVYWVAVFEGNELQSNLLWSLQVTEDAAPTPAGPNSLTNPIKLLPIPSQGGTSELQRLPKPLDTRVPARLQSPLQPPPRVRIRVPGSESDQSHGAASDPKTEDVLEKRPSAPPKSTGPPVLAPVQPPETAPRIPQPRLR